MILSFQKNGRIIFAATVLLFFQLRDAYGQLQPLDQPTPSLTLIENTNPEFDRSVLKLVDSVRAMDILPIIHTLASDSFEGRAAGSTGFIKAANFVQRHFEQCGLRPVGSSYFQKFKLDTKTVRSRVHLEEIRADSVETMNVIGLKEGTLHRDEYVVITAHLDHLGKKLDSIYYGANDNASGVAVMMTVALALKNISTERSVIFIAFAGEEVGLNGSAYFVTHAPIDLKKIKLLINLDLVGSGKQGLMVQGVDGHESEFSEIRQINQKYFQFELGTRLNSPNSDQYYFHLLGVPAFFMYAYNGTIPYHSPGDTADKIDPAVVENVAKFVLMNVWNFAQKAR